MSKDENNLKKDLDNLDNLVNSMYSDVVRASNTVLRNCKRFSIKALQEEDPTYDEIANHMDEMCKIIEDVIDPDAYTNHDWTLSKAREFARYVRNIAKAVSAGNDIELKELTKQAEQWSFL